MGTLTNLAGRAFTYAMADKCPYKEQCALGSSCHKVEQEVLDCGMYQSHRDIEDSYAQMARESKAEEEAREERQRQREIEEEKEMERRINERAQELLDQYKEEALPYFKKAADILEGKIYLLEPSENDFCGELWDAKRNYFIAMENIPVLESANIYHDFCEEYDLTPEDDVVAMAGRNVVGQAYVKYLTQLLEYGEKTFPNNEYVQKDVKDTRDEFRKIEEQKEKERAEKEAAEKAKREEEERQAAEEKAKKDAIKAEQARIRKEKKEQKKIEEKKKKQFRAKIYFLSCIAIVGIALLSCSYEWYHYVLTIAGMGLIYYLWFFQNLDKLYDKALEALDVYDIML